MEIIPPIRTAPPASSRAFYQAYLNSPTWRLRRNRALKLAGWHCSRCESRRGLEVHHRSYDRLGAELDADLEVLCADCHEGHHVDEGVQQNLGVYVKIVSDLIQRKGYTSIGDLAEAAKITCAKLKIPYLAQQIDAAIMVVRDRIPVAKLPRAAGRVSIPANPEVEVSRDEAPAVLRALNVKVGLRSMPRLNLVTLEEADRRKAKRMIAELFLHEIQSAIDRCDALESELPKDAK